MWVRKYAHMYAYISPNKSKIQNLKSKNERSSKSHGFETLVEKMLLQTYCCHHHRHRHRHSVSLDVSLHRFSTLVGSSQVVKPICATSYALLIFSASFTLFFTFIGQVCECHMSNGEALRHLCDQTKRPVRH